MTHWQSGRARCVSRTAHHSTRSPPPPSDVNGWKNPTLLGTRVPDRSHCTKPVTVNRTHVAAKWAHMAHMGILNVSSSDHPSPGYVDMAPPALRPLMRE